MRIRKAAQSTVILCIALYFLVALTTACQGEMEAVEVTKIVSETVVEREAVIDHVAQLPAAEAGESVRRESSTVGPEVNFQSQASQRLIIKDASLELEVGHTDRAIDAVTQIAGDLGGYIISQRVWYGGDAKFAAITMAVPAQEFEHALRRLRGLATQVLSEEASGQDVTDQYVDLQSRLRNLEATRDRVRSFLDRAEKVEDALEVSRQLSDIEGQIEQVKGRLNYFRDRAAFSTITVNLSPTLPAPATETWQPGETVRQAVDELTSVVVDMAEQLIWVTIVLGPFILIFGVSSWVAVTMARRLSRRRSAIPSPPVEKPASEDRLEDRQR